MDEHHARTVLEQLAGADAEEERVLDVLAGGTGAPAGEHAVLRRLLGVFSANADALAAYRPRPYLGRCTVLGAAGDTALEESGGALGWDSFVADLEVGTVPGDHYSIMRSPHVHDLSEHLRTILDAVAPAPAVRCGVHNLSTTAPDTDMWSPRRSG
jgi:thioesterase domain-containing protein